MIVDHRLEEWTIPVGESAIVAGVVLGDGRIGPALRRSGQRCRLGASDETRLDQELVRERHR